MPATDADVTAALEAATPVAHLMDEDLLAVCGASADATGWLRVTPVAGDVTCPACQSPARTITLRTHAGAYARNRMPDAVHVLANEVPGVVVGTACGRVFAFARTSGMTVEAEGKAVTCRACRDAG